MPGKLWDVPETTPRDPNQRIGFQDVNKVVVAKRGVKIKNKSEEKRLNDKKEREEYKQKFSQNADRTVVHHTESSKKAVEVITRFMNLSQDKTLKINRGSIAEDVEREARQDILQLALDLNNDESEPDNGKGSVVVVSLLSKILLTYRDRINELEYELLQLKRENLSSQPSGKRSNEAQ